MLDLSLLDLKKQCWIKFVELRKRVYMRPRAEEVKGLRKLYSNPSCIQTNCAKAVLDNDKDWITSNKTDNPKFYGKLTESGLFMNKSNCNKANIFHYFNSPTLKHFTSMNY